MKDRNPWQIDVMYEDSEESLLLQDLMLLENNDIWAVMALEFASHHPVLDCFPLNSMVLHVLVLTYIPFMCAFVFM